jgi:hypothetical protein
VLKGLSQKPLFLWFTAKSTWILDNNPGLTPDSPSGG